MMRIAVILIVFSVLTGFGFGYSLELIASMLAIINSSDCGLCAEENYYFYTHVKFDPVGSTRERVLQHFGKPDSKSEIGAVGGPGCEIWAYKPSFGMNSGFSIHFRDGRCEGHLLNRHAHFH